MYCRVTPLDADAAQLTITVFGLPFVVATCDCVRQLLANNRQQTNKKTFFMIQCASGPTKNSAAARHASPSQPSETRGCPTFTPANKNNTNARTSRTICSTVSSPFRRDRQRLAAGDGDRRKALDSSVRPSVRRRLQV